MSNKYSQAILSTWEIRPPFPKRPLEMNVWRKPHVTWTQTALCEETDITLYACPSFEFSKTVTLIQSCWCVPGLDI